MEPLNRAVLPVCLVLAALVAAACAPTPLDLEAPPLDVIVSAEGDEEPADPLLAAGVTENRLGDGDAKLDGGEWIDWYRLRLTAGQSATLRIESAEFATWLLADTANESISEAGNQPQPGALSRVEGRIDPVAPGDYRIGVTSVAAAETGAYRLTVTIHEPGPIKIEAGAAPTIGVGSFVGEATGSLAINLQAPADLPEGAGFSLVLWSAEGVYTFGELPDGASLSDWEPLRFAVVPWVTAGSAVRVNLATDGDTAAAFALRVVVDPRPERTTPAVAASVGSVSGEWTRTDGVTDGRYNDRYTYSAAAQRRITLTLTSESVDTLLVVTDAAGNEYINDDMEDGDTNSQLVIDTEMPGELMIHAQPLEAGVVGSYSLTIADDAPSGDPDMPELPDPGPDAGPLPGEAQGGPYAAPVALPAGPLSGQLTDSDHPLTSGEFCEWFAVEMTQGERLRLQLVSNDFNAYLIVIDPDEEYHDNDDAEGGEGTNALVVIDECKAGRYVVGVTSSTVGETGAWALTWSRRGSDIGGTEGDPDPITAGVYHGALAQGDAQLVDDNNEFVDWFHLAVQAGDKLVIETTSGEFDAYLLLKLPNSSDWLNDDDGGVGTNARLEAEVAEAGNAMLGVTSAATGETGAYQLSIRVQRAASGSGTADDPILVSGGEFDGTLMEGDPKLDSGEAVDWYAVDGREGMSLRVDLMATEFDAYLVVQAPSGVRLDNDDREDGVSDSRVDITLEENGRYMIGATTYEPGEHGDYRLTVRTGRGTDRVTLTPIAVGQAVAGVLEETDGQLPDRRHADFYSLELPAGASVRINLTAVDCGTYDTVLIVRTPDGGELTNDDASPNSQDSLLHFTASEAGTYTLVATNYEAGMKGAYTLSVVQVEGSEGSTRQVTRAAEGVTYWGIFCGITSYNGNASDLAFCREDAEKLAGSFRAAGLMDNSNQTVLVDNECTAVNIRRAFERLKTRVDDDDIVVFFYSGHGMRTDPGDYPGEVDDRNDLLYLSDDSAVSDDDLAAWLGELPEGALKIVALDACHSGGFARDVVSTRGRVGFFSSEEDVTSAVADEFRAGGYLSLMFRRAIEGQADLDSDHAVTIGEVKDYLVAEFAKHCNAESEDDRGAITRQTLVADRGAVAPDTVFFRTR